MLFHWATLGVSIPKGNCFLTFRFQITLWSPGGFVLKQNGILAREGHYLLGAMLPLALKRFR